MPNRSRSRWGAVVLAAVLVAVCAAPAQAEKPPKRIVALTPFSANTLAELGVKPVAVGVGVGGSHRLDPSLRNVPKLALSHASNGPNLEQLVARRPDLVFSERTWRAGHEAIRELGIAVRESDPYRAAAIAKKVRAIGKVIGRENAAARLAKRKTKELAAARRGISERPRVLMILGVGQTPYAFLPNSWGGDLVARAGGSLLTDGLSAEGSDLLVSGGFAQLSDEEILLRNPDVIIAVPHGRADDMEAIAEELREDETFAATNAGANGRIYVSQDNRLLQASLDAAKTIKKVRRDFLLNL